MSFLKGEERFQPLTELLVQLRALRNEPSDWLRAWRPLRTYQHNDLNAANVLVDVQGEAWLIDFARCAALPLE